MIEIIGLLIFIAPIIGLLVHLARLGTFYIQYTGLADRRAYQVWRRRFMGYDDLLGGFATEKDARVCISELINNPPRKIRL